jgi:hypothetical protein
VLGDNTIIIECKNYQNSNLTIRNIIHQWNSKNQLIKADKIIIVLAGLNLKDSDKVLASEFNIELWDQDNLSELFNLSLKPEELRLRLLEMISFKVVTISERYRDEITYMVIKGFLSNEMITKEFRYRCFNKWLRSHILTELQMSETSISEREKHIELFEGSKRKKGFIYSRQRTEVEYWDTVLEQLTENEILSRETQDKYLSYIHDLEEEFHSQKLFFDSDDYLAQAKRLIKSRLHNAIFLGESCEFYTDPMNNWVKVIYNDNGNFTLHITHINEKQGNVINWIMTSEYKRIYNEEHKRYHYVWTFGSFQETVDKIYRIFTEHYQISSSHRIRDRSLKDNNLTNYLN